MHITLNDTQPIKLLNHGSIRLVESMGSDLSIVRAARTSYAAEWRTGEDEGKDGKLIEYLVKNYHTSPLEAVTLTFDVVLPLFVARQWMRHRTMAYSEVSARYSELPEVYYVPEISAITAQSVNNKQQRTDEVLPTAEAIQAMLADQCAEAFKVYRALLAKGCPRELARGVLPLNTFTHYFCTVNLLNLAKFIKLRSHSHAQMEIRVYSDAMLELTKTVAPVTMAAVEKYWLVC
jgi:thymidylate synthase (FAD)